MRLLTLSLAIAASIAAFSAPVSASPSPAPETAHVTEDGTYYTASSAKMIPCKSGYICLYTGAGFTGYQVSWIAGNYHPNFTAIPCPVGYCSNNDFNDDASSWANNGTGILYCVSENVGGGGWDNSMPTGMQGDFTGIYNNTASSLSRSGCP